MEGRNGLHYHPMAGGGVMADLPFLPLCPSAYLADTLPISRVNWEHHGIYTLSLMIAWLTPGCRLPNDEKWLAERFGCTIEEYHESVKPVLDRYWMKRRNWLYQKRLSKEHLFITQKRATQQANAAKRWNKKKKGGATASTPQKRKIASGNAPIPTPIPIPRKKKEGYLTVSQEKEFVEWWSLVPLKVGRKAAKAKFKTALKETNFETLKVGIIRYARQVAEKDTKFIAHPATWLHGERWLDEPERKSHGNRPHGNGDGHRSPHAALLEAGAWAARGVDSGTPGPTNTSAEDTKPGADGSKGIDGASSGVPKVSRTRPTT